MRFAAVLVTKAEASVTTHQKENPQLVFAAERRGSPLHGQSKQR